MIAALALALALVALAVAAFALRRAEASSESQPPVVVNLAKAVADDAASHAVDRHVADMHRRSS